MPRGKTRSKLSLSARRQHAFEYISKGWNDRQIAEKLEVSRQTVQGYRRLYEANIAKQAAANPGMLREVLTNTIRSLQELEAIRATAWANMEPRKVKQRIDCEECGHPNKIVMDMEPGHQMKAAYLNTLIKAQDQRAKLYGVLGVKAEVLNLVTQVKMVQDRILKFMQEEMCGPDRTKLEHFLTSDEMRPYLGLPELPETIDVDSEEVA